MTQAFQTGQFHTGSTDTPATTPSVFVAADGAAQSAVDAEESVTQQLAAAAGDPKIGLVEADSQLVAREKVEEPKAEPKAEAKKSAPKKAEAKKVEEDEVEYEEVAVEDLTIPELKAELDEAEVDYPSTARKPELVKLVKKNVK